MRDVAHVRDGAAPQTNVVHVNGQRSALLTVLKNGAASTSRSSARSRTASRRLSPTRENDRAAGDVGRTVVGAALSYEIDLWGRARSEAMAGEAEAAAANADMESVRLTLHAAIAEDSLVLRTLHAEEALLRAEERRNRETPDETQLGGAPSASRISARLRGVTSR